MAPDELPDRLGPDEIALVLRRAAELDVASGQPDDEGLPVEAIEAAAAEVGLPPAAVRQAVAELRAGLLAEPAERPARGTLVEAGVVPFAPDEAIAMVGRWLESQSFTRHRVRGGAHVWRPRDDLFAKLHRSFDWVAPMRLKDVREVTVRAVEVSGGTLVRVEATLDDGVVAAPGIGAGLGGVAGSTTGVVGGLLASASTPAIVATGATLAGVGAVGGWWVGVRHRRARAEQVADELSAHLDRVGHGEAATPGVLDRWRRRLGPGGAAGTHRHT
jgi:hypothetical protein